jgi:hypothetical protein
MAPVRRRTNPPPDPRARHAARPIAAAALAASIVEAQMPVYLIYIEDARYSAPQLDSLEAIDDARALDVVRVRLQRSIYYHAADLWVDDRFVGRIVRVAA